MQFNNTTFLAIASLVLAILFPTYWWSEFNVAGLHTVDSFHLNLMQFTIGDIVFLSLGVLSVIVYLGLKSALNDQLGITTTDIPLILIAAVSAVFFGGFFLLDVIVSAAPDAFGAIARDSLLRSSIFAFVGLTVVFGVLDIVIAIFLIKEMDKLPSILKAAAIVILIQGICEVSVIFGPVSMFTFPLMLVLLFIYFLGKPEELEVV